MRYPLASRIFFDSTRVSGRCKKWRLMDQFQMQISKLPVLLAGANYPPGAGHRVDTGGAVSVY
jgi:hypothetical protein